MSRAKFKMRESTKEWLSRKLPSRIRNLHFLIHAIRSEDEDYIDSVTTEDVYINGNYFDDGTPLHVAAQIGNYKIFQKLIKIGADIHKRHPTTQETVLDIAMKSFNYDIVKYLKENGVEKYDRTKRAELQFAADEGTKEVMALLLTNKADINAKSDDEIILINAAKAKYYDLMDAALMKYVLDLFCICKGDCNTKTIFHGATDINHYTVLKNWLISFSRNLDLNKNDDFFSYFKCCMSSHKDFLSSIRTVEGLSMDVKAIYPIKRHIVELIAAGFYVSARNITDINKTKIYDDYSAECLLEVEKMKKNVIEGSNITFIEILHKNVRYLARYLKIVDLNKILIREPQFPEYPIYENKIFFKLWKTQIRVNYVKHFEEVIYNIFYELQLPATFIRELYIYLSNDDLKEIVQPSG